MEPVLDLYLDKINEVITNTTVAENIFPVSDVALLTNEDGSPRQSPPRTRFEYGDDAKELLFKITGTAGVASDPVSLGIILGGQPVKSNLNVKISENDYRTQVIEIFPLGLLDIEIMEDDLQIKPGGDEKYTGTFEACGIEAEDVFKMYQSNQLPNGNVRGNDLKKMIEDQGLVSDMITKTREIYFEPLGEDCVKVHFGIDGDDGVTASGLQEDMLAEDDTIELVDDDGTTVGRLSDLELSSERRFEVEVTTDLPPGQIISRLENEPNSPEFENIENIREEDGKTVFDFVTDRNLNIVPANFPALEEKINSILESEDATIRVPGSDMIPLRQYIGTVRIQSDEASVAPILANYLDPVIIGLNLPEQWVIDYKAAVELDVIEAYVAAEIGFGAKRADIVNEVSELLDSGNTFTLNAPRAFRGKCLMLDAGIEPELLNKTIHEFVIGLNPNLKTSAIYQGVDAIYAFGRERRQAGEDELEVKFYFQSLDAERLIPAQLEAQGKRIIAGNPSFATLYDSSSLEITPLMFEEDITPVTLPTQEPTTEPTTTEPTVEPTIVTIETVDSGNKVTPTPATAPTIPPVVSRDAISVYNCTDVPSDDDVAGLIGTLESEIESSCPKTEQVDCSNTVVRDDVFIVQCKYTVTADRVDTIDNVEESLDSCLPDKIECLARDISYIVHPTRNKCMDAFENDCNPDTSVCDYNEEVVCKCIEGHEKKDENDIKSACVPTGPDVVLIILIVLIIILFLVILLLSYFVHQKRTKTGMYSPAKHQPTQIQS